MKLEDNNIGLEYTCHFKVIFMHVLFSLLPNILTISILFVSSIFLWYMSDFMPFALISSIGLGEYYLNVI